MQLALKILGREKENLRKRLEEAERLYAESLTAADGRQQQVSRIQIEMDDITQAIGELEKSGATGK